MIHDLTPTWNLSARKPLSIAEVAAATVTCWLASIPLWAYLIDAAGFTISATVVLVGSLMTAAVVALSLTRLARRGLADLGAWAAVVLALCAWMLRLAWPTLLPPGRGSDLSHHLLLADYLERHWQLVHDPALAGVMGEMVQYTPGAHLLAVLAGAWTGTNALRAFYPLVAGCTALAAGFVFLIARRLSLPLPFAIVGVMLLLLPDQFFVGAFTHSGFLAQAVSTLFAVAMWWAIAVWDEQPSPAIAVVIGIVALGVFLAWPVWIGPPLLVFAAALFRAGVPLGTRLRHLAIVAGPLAVVFAIHAAGRVGAILIVRTSGGVLRPSIEIVGWAFPLLAAAGLALSFANRRAWATRALLIALSAQAVTLWFLAKSNGAETPYMAYKMSYLAIYPLAVLGGLAIGRPLAGAPAPTAGGAGAQVVGWALAAILMVTILRPVLGAARQVPAVSTDLYEAGQWVRANVGAACVDYIVANADTAYWLHLAVLGNPRASARAVEVDRYDPHATIGHWVAFDGRLGYAIADIRLLPAEVRSRVEVVAQFGTAAVIKRPDQPPCISR